MIDTPVPASFLLLVILVLPFMGAMIASGLPRHARTSAAVLSWIIALISVGCLAVLWPRFQDGEVLKLTLAWLPSLGVNLTIRLDGLSWLFSALILGIGEHTALILDCAHSTCQVMGRSGVTILRGDSEQYLPTGSETPLDALFDWQPIEPANGLPAEVWRRALEIAQEQPSRPTAPPEALALAEARQAARARRDWAAADALRAQIEASGWQVQDTPAGPQLIPRS